MTKQSQERAPALGIPWAGIALVNVATLTWASNMTLGRWLRGDVGPLTLAAARFLIASTCLTALLARVPSEERRLGRDRWLLAGMALSGVVIFTPTLYLGLRYTTAVNATLINGMGPLITGLFAAVLIRERMSGPQLAGAVVGLMGVTILISGGSFRFWESMQGSIGDLIVLAAVALWALYSVLGRRVMAHRSALSASAFSALLGLPVLLAAAAWEIAVSDSVLEPRLILPLIYIGIAPGVIGFLSWNAGVRRLGASGAMVFYNTLPLYGALLGHLLLGETLGFAHLLGGVLIVSGGLWAAQPGRSKRASLTKHRARGTIESSDADS
jgi:drug/metabolite transporter (DMT)-like permease